MADDLAYVAEAREAILAGADWRIEMEDALFFGGDRVEACGARVFYKTENGRWCSRRKAVWLINNEGEPDTVANALRHVAGWLDGPVDVKGSASSAPEVISHGAEEASTYEPSTKADT